MIHYQKLPDCSEEQLLAIAYLRTPAAIRERCDRLFHLACADQLQYFRCNLTHLDRVAHYVIEVMRNEYPDLNIPFHSRWRHFEVGNVLRLAELEQHLAGLTPLEKAQTKFDLAIISVLLDAGAGSEWQYGEQETGQVFRRSEGLAVASFRMFCQGAFSSNPKFPLQADAQGLQNFTATQLAQGFQVSSTNPLLGLEGRVELLQRLGQSLHSLPQLFGTENPRPGNLVNYLLQGLNVGKLNVEGSQKQLNVGELKVENSTQTNLPFGNAFGEQPSTSLPASTVFSAVLEGLGNIWPGRLTIAGVNLGDVWIHPALKGDNPSAQYVPFHKLSQWLTYSLLEPLQELGIEITGLDEMTGLPEYRNGGLCLDLGLLEAKQASVVQERHFPESEVIVEWRSLTVSLLDRIADTIRQQLNLTAAQLPLVKVLQGGTWTAGRRIAAQLREGGVPPIQIESDGTVF
ncbi:URC4/urg3 family protein [Microcoleus sp. FACHB-53]|nr:URC4/urg3 family protein [Microcoleus sp. FACHB-53]